MPTAHPAPLLEVAHLHKRFGPVHAVRGVSFRLAAGETLAIAGGDGSGKTMVAKVIAGFYAPDGGELRYFGRTYRFASADDARAAGVGFVCQDQAFAGRSGLAKGVRAHVAPRILVLDEPEAALSPGLRDKLAALIESLKHDGAGVIFVSRHLDDIFAFADRIIVLRKGAMVGERHAAATDPDEVARLMDG